MADIESSIMLEDVKLIQMLASCGSVIDSMLNVDFKHSGSVWMSRNYYDSVYMKVTIPSNAFLAYKFLAETKYSINATNLQAAAQTITGGCRFEGKVNSLHLLSGDIRETKYIFRTFPPKTIDRLDVVSDVSGLVDLPTMIDIVAPLEELGNGFGWFTYDGGVARALVRNNDPVIEMSLDGMECDKDIIVSMRYNVRPLFHILAEVSRIAQATNTEIACTFAYGPDKPAYIEFVFLGATFQFWFAPV